MLMVDDYMIEDDYNYSESINIPLNYFLAGLIFYTVGFLASVTTFVSSLICGTIQLFGLLLLIPSAIKLINYKFENNYLKGIYLLYCSWLVLVILRGFIIDFVFLKKILLDAFKGIFIYFVPLILLFPRTMVFYKKIFSIILIFGILYIAFYLILIALLNLDITDSTGTDILEYFSKTLSFPCGFILLTYTYHTKKRNYFALFVIILTILMAILRARRALAFIGITMIILAIIIYSYSNKKYLIRILSLSIFIAIVSFVGFKVYEKNKQDAFSLITDRAFEDTRSGVELYFFSDMTLKDWIIGKGINGRYYCPTIDTDAGFYRDGIETGYLNIILKGGIINLVLLLLIAVPGMLKGIFYSKNILSKAAGFWILIYLVRLYPTPLTNFALFYLLVWISIGICYSEDIRNMSDNSIKELLYI